MLICLALKAKRLYAGWRAERSRLSTSAAAFPSLSEGDLAIFDPGYDKMSYNIDLILWHYVIY